MNKYDTRGNKSEGSNSRGSILKGSHIFRHHLPAGTHHSALPLAWATLEFVWRLKAVQMKSPASITLARLTPWKKKMKKKREKVDKININKDRMCCNRRVKLELQ